MAHVAREKAKLLNRLKRMRGQLAAIERAVESDGECARVLQQATACRGALNGFIAEVIEDHIREHMIDPQNVVVDDRRGRVVSREVVAVNGGGGDVRQRKVGGELYAVWIKLCAVQLIQRAIISNGLLPCVGIDDGCGDS